MKHGPCLFLFFFFLITIPLAAQHDGVTFQKLNGHVARIKTGSIAQIRTKNLVIHSGFITAVGDSSITLMSVAHDSVTYQFSQIAGIRRTQGWKFIAGTGLVVQCGLGAFLVPVLASMGGTTDKGFLFAGEAVCLTGLSTGYLLFHSAKNSWSYPVSSLKPFDLSDKQRTARAHQQHAHHSVFADGYSLGLLGAGYTYRWKFGRLWAVRGGIDLGYLFRNTGRNTTAIAYNAGLEFGTYKTFSASFVTMYEFVRGRYTCGALICYRIPVSKNLVIMPNVSLLNNDRLIPESIPGVSIGMTF